MRVANRVKQFFFDELFQTEFGDEPPTGFFLGFKVCGYSAGAGLPELWDIRIVENRVVGPKLVRGQESAGPNWDGEYEAMDRLILGIGANFKKVLTEEGVPESDVEEAASRVIDKLSVPVVLAAMPIKDAIDLASFMVETTIRFVGFNMRAATVGEPIEVAAITKHEGFKWVKRKLFFSEELNP
jgi:hypothetical protein